MAYIVCAVAVSTIHADYVYRRLNMSRVGKDVRPFTLESRPRLFNGLV